jgi:hypothetical protein
MIRHTRWAACTFSIFAMLAGLAAASAAHADDAAVFGCRADDQSTEVSTDCDSHVQEAKVKIEPPPTTTPPVILYSIMQGEGDKHDHDRDPGGEGGSQGRDGKDRPR